MKKKLFTLLLALVAIATTAQAQNTNGHEYVDLGLPSGTLWATCNVGASKPEEYGDYFAWGETQPKNDYSLAIYKWYSENEYTKYGNDGKTELDLEDDAANANWGSQWRMPSKEQQDELRNQCTCEWTQLNGVNGHKVTSKTNGKSIFLPAAGCRYDTSLYDAGSDGNYWSRSLNTYYPSSAYDQSFISGQVGYGYNSRYGGRSVRPVLVNNQSSGLILNAANFPDANFRAALAEILGISEGDEITAAKIAATTALSVSKRSNTPSEEKITDLTGIEHFTALTSLDCNYNNLTSLDLSKNIALTNLDCNYNQLTSLDVSKNTALTSLRCYYNQLTSLDVSKNTALKYLYCDNNQLTSLDVSKNTALTSLYCYNNKLTSLDVSKNTKLKSLYCRKNQLTSLNVSNNTALNYLYCDNNQLTSLDVSKNTALTTLDCGSNQLTSLDVSKNTALTTLWCDYNQLTSLDVSKNTALASLRCYDNQLTSLDVSNNTALTDLNCSRNQLTTLDVSKNTALEYLNCSSNLLTSLDVSKNTALTDLYCYSNQLTSLDVSKNTALTSLMCNSNQIKGEAMDALVASLPSVKSGTFFVIDTKDENEGNVCTKSQVAVAKEKGWIVYDYNGGVYDENYEYPEYEGSDPVEKEIDPVDEDDNVDFGSDMDESDDLNGNVIGDIFYNISDGNGEYNAEEGCIVLKKTTDDETVDGLNGKDIFGEDFKGQFTGIVFKVPSGKGTVKVTAETTGNMLLKVKIGDNDPVEMELNGKLKISFPYNVSETTFVAIYAGAVNEAKGFGTTNATTDAALKIYGIEFIRDETTAIDASLNDNGQRINDSWYTIDGVKLNGEPTKKGIYIYNGKKVKK